MPDQLPPSLSGAPKPGYSPASVNSGNPGQMAGALQIVRQAVEMLNAQVSKLPIGTDAHKNVMKMIELGAKVVPSGDQQPGIQKTALQGLVKNQAQQAPLAAMIGSMGQQQPAMGAQQ